MFVASNKIPSKALGTQKDLSARDAPEEALARHKTSCHMSVPIPVLIGIYVNLNPEMQLYPELIDILSLIILSIFFYLVTFPLYGCGTDNVKIK